MLRRGNQEIGSFEHLLLTKDATAKCLLNNSLHNNITKKLQLKED
jgi:hypothetical protein